MTSEQNMTWSAVEDAKTAIMAMRQRVPPINRRPVQAVLGASKSALRQPTLNLKAQDKYNE